MAAHLEVPRTQWTGKQATWRALEDHQRAIRGRHLRTLFTDDPARSERMTAEAAGVFLDYSKNRMIEASVGISDCQKP
jgi:glucose-6-phosphate isomerase